MGAGYYGGFGNTLGTTYENDLNIYQNTYKDRGIEIPENLKEYLSKLQKYGDYIEGSIDDFNSTEVSIMSKEARVEFVKIKIGEKTYLIRGDKQGTTLPDEIFKEMIKENGILDELEKLEIQEGDTVRMYGLQFDYYK